MAFAPGSIAFVGYNADGNDGVAFVVLEPVLAGSVISFTDNAWNGSAFSSGQATWDWTATSDLAAGTVVAISGLSSSVSTNHGLVSFSDQTSVGLQGENGAVYAYAGTASSPTFLSAMANNTFASAGGSLSGTGLVAGQSALELGSNADIAAYTGPRGGMSYADLQEIINAPVNWAGQDSNVDDSSDGIAPDLPFPTDPFDGFDIGDGDDTVVVDEDTTVFQPILLGAGDDTLTAVAGDLEVDGEEGDDVITTGEGDDIIRGGVGNDTLDGGEGDDEIDGGEGDDVLKGRAGDDDLAGGLGNDVLSGGEGDDLIDGGQGIDTVDYSDDESGVTVDLSAGEAFGDDAGEDSIANVENVIGGSGDDTLIHGAGANVLIGGSGEDSITVGAGDTAIGGTGDDTIEVVSGGTGTTSVDGGAGSDTITIRDGGHVSSALNLSENDRLVLDADGKLVATNAITWSGGDVLVDNAGLIEGSRTLQTTGGAQGDLVFNNLVGGVVRGALNPQQSAAADATITINNSGLIEASSGGRVIDFRSFDGAGAHAIINNLAGGVIRNVGATSDDADVLRPGQNGTVNNWGTIIAAEGLVGGGDLIDFQSDRGGSVNNHAGGWMEGSRHAVTGDHAVTVVNDGTMIGRNGSAVNIDNDGDVEDTVHITNRGTMEGRSAELGDSDGDAVDVDGLLNLLNYGVIAGMGHEGYHDGEPNVSEGIAIGGGTILNYGADAVIYGYGRAIQVDNSSNENALGSTFINNDGLIKGDGHGPEGVDPDDAAQFDLRGNEAINFVGDYDDEILNQSTGRIVGGISMGGGNDRLNNSGLISATGGSAIDMGAGDDVVNLYIGTNLQGTVLLGAGDDRLTANAYMNMDIEVDGGDGDDTITTSYGNDTVFGGAGNDWLFASNGNDEIHGGEGDDTIAGEAGNDRLFGGAGDDRFYVGLGNDVIDGGDGYDTLDLSLVNGPVNVDFAAGRISGTGVGFDTFTNVENLMFGTGNDTVTGGNGDDSFDGGAGNDTLKGGAGDDTIAGGEGNDVVDGGSGDDALSGGVGNDVVTAGSGDDEIDGGDGNDQIDAGSGDDLIMAGAGNDVVLAGSGDDRIEGGAGNDTLSGGSGQDSFVFAAGFGRDTVTDFKISGSSSDVLEFSTDVFADFAAAIAAADQVGSDTVFTFDANNTLTLEGVHLASLQTDDFRFV